MTGQYLRTEIITSNLTLKIHLRSMRLQQKFERTFK